MGSNNSTLAIINAGKCRVEVDIESFKVGKQKSSALLSVGGIKIKEKIDQSVPKLSATIDPGSHYDFQLTKHFIGGNVKVTFLRDKKLSKYQQHRKNEQMIITLEEEIIYSSKKEPWIEINKEKGEKINHLEIWNEWNNKFLEFQEKTNEVKKNYQRNRTEVSVKRQKKYKQVDEEYSIDKENVKNEAKASVEKLKTEHGIGLWEVEDFTQTIGAIPKNTKVENQSSGGHKLLEAGVAGLQTYLGNKS